MAIKKTGGSVVVPFDLLNRLNALKAKLSTEEKRVKVKELVREALEKYLKEQGG